MLDYQNITVERDDAVATVTLNRPEVLNALNHAMIAELEVAFARLDHDSGVRAVVLTGAGERAFAAGADIAELRAVSSSAAGANVARAGQALTTRIERMRKPVIVAVNGFALGGGCELALAGDVRIADENAKFGQPEVNLGLTPGYGGTQRVARLAGRGMALLLCLTGELIDAREAYRIGLVERVVPPGQAVTEARRIAALIATKAPLAVEAIKRVVGEGAGLPLGVGLALEALAFGTMFDTADAQEGTSAFLEKRKPAFRGV